MNFGIPSAFAYADQIWTGMMFLGAFCAGYVVGGVCQR
jgi:hypothetical protein